ncbi:MAG: hypothetical protein AVDCRST_MAG59-3935, partial [uncultured Thermomicrobiales bacterium]
EDRRCPYDRRGQPLEKLGLCPALHRRGDRRHRRSDRGPQHEAARGGRPRAEAALPRHGPARRRRRLGQPLQGQLPEPEPGDGRDRDGLLGYPRQEPGRADLAAARWQGPAPHPGLRQRLVQGPARPRVLRRGGAGGGRARLHRAQVRPLRKRLPLHRRRRAAPVAGDRGGGPRRGRGVGRPPDRGARPLLRLDRDRGRPGARRVPPVLVRDADDVDRARRDGRGGAGHPGAGRRRRALLCQGGLCQVAGAAGDRRRAAGDPPLRRRLGLDQDRRPGRGVRGVRRPPQRPEPVHHRRQRPRRGGPAEPPDPGVLRRLPRPVEPGDHERHRPHRRRVHRGAGRPRLRRRPGRGGDGEVPLRRAQLPAPVRGRLGAPRFPGRL